LSQLSSFPGLLHVVIYQLLLESTDNGFNVLEFHGGVAYDHESLPKIVAVHTLVHVGSEQTHVHDEDGTLTQADVKVSNFI
jgi:hypothetical protein